ncbi:MAG: hypothetical protein WCW66_05270 [Patescibacteria group bacterium]
MEFGTRKETQSTEQGSSIDETVSDPKSLLRSPDEVEKIKYEDRYAYSATNGEENIFIDGRKHTNQLQKIHDFEKTLAEINPDLVLTEVASTLETYFPGKTIDEISAMDPKEIIDRQEQLYFTWLARKQGFKVQSWDISGLDQLKAVLNIKAENNELKHNTTEAITWLATYGMRKLYEDGKEPSLEALYDLILFAVPGVEKYLDLTSEKIAEVVEKEAGLPFNELASRSQNEALRAKDQDLFTKSSDPSPDSVAHDMNTMRDNNAIDVILDAKKSGHKNILVTAGATHAVVWEKAIKNIYRSS